MVGLPVFVPPYMMRTDPPPPPHPYVDVLHGAYAVHPVQSLLIMNVQNVTFQATSMINPIHPCHHTAIVVSQESIDDQPEPPEPHETPYIHHATSSSIHNLGLNS